MVAWIKYTYLQKEECGMRPATPISDADAVAFCRKLKSPLREDVAAILQWDMTPEKMPMTKALAKIYGIPPERKHATPDQVEEQLALLGYANPKARVSNVTEYVQMMRMARQRFISRRVKARKKKEKQDGV